MASGYPDWTRAIQLLAIDGDGNLTTILVDADGRMYARILGEEADGTLQVVRVDSNGQMIMVPRGSSGNYMSIDSDGYMTAVLKGAYGAALRTIGLDDEGRITAYLADDESQWGDVVKTGNAELAARLGSPVAYDWRGKVLWWTDFRYGLGGIDKTESGAGASVTLDPTHFLSGGYSAKLTGGSSSAYYASLNAFFDIPPSPRIGFYFRWASDWEFDFLNLQMQIYDGTEYWEAFIRYDRDNSRIDYQDENQTWQSLAAQKYFHVNYDWHGLKLVVDIGTGKYLRCLAGSTEHDMSTLDMYSFDTVTDQRLVCTAKVYSHSGNNECVWVDAMVVTVGEPT